MRSIALLAALVIVAAWAMFRHLPNTSANAEAAVNRPVARLQEVRSIALDGRHLPQARLRDVLETRPGEQLDCARLERDRGAMERALAGVPAPRHRNVPVELPERYDAVRDALHRGLDA